MSMANVSRSGSDIDESGILALDTPKRVIHKRVTHKSTIHDRPHEHFSLSNTRTDTVGTSATPVRSDESSHAISGSVHAVSDFEAASYYLGISDDPPVLL